MNQQARFIIGAMIGFLSSGVALAYFSTYLAGTVISGAVLSAFTFAGIALAVLGYYEHRKGVESLISDFFFGLGIGIVLISFVSAGYGSISLI